MRELPVEDRPRERLWREGSASLATRELLAIVLRNGTHDETALGLADRVLVSTGGLRELMTAEPSELSRVKGIGRAKAAEIAAAIELGRRGANLAPQRRLSVTCPRDVAELLMPEMRFLAKEHFRVLLLNTKNQIVANELVSIGTLNSSLVHPRELFRTAIQRSCAAVILAHNHPSGDPTPSTEDIGLTTRVLQAGKVLGIEVLDHLVIGDNTFVSLKEKGVL